MDSRSTILPAAPLLMCTYGIIRLLSHHHGPGLAWTAGHLLLLLGALTFIPAFLLLGRLADGTGPVRRTLARTASVVAAIGALAVVVQAAVDIYAGAVSADHAHLSQIQSDFQNQPLVKPLVYTVVPVLFFAVGFLVLAGVLAYGQPRLIPAWVPLVLLAGMVLMGLGLDYLPLATLFFAFALTSVQVSRTRTPVAQEPLGLP